MAKVKKDDASNKAGIDEKLSMDQVLQKINKAYGVGTIARSSRARALSVPRIETGIFGIDYATGGGFASGRINGVFGLKSSGKTVVALKSIASAQRYCRKHLIKMKRTNKKLYRCLECGYKGEKAGSVCPDCKEAGFDSRLLDFGDRVLKCPECKNYDPMIAVFFDAEGTWENFWAAKMGVNCHHVFVIRTEYAEQAIDISDTILRNGQCDLLVIDTLAHLIPSVEIQESAEKWQVGVQARLVNKMLRKLVSAQNAPNLDDDTRPTVLLLNQVRMKVGVMWGCFHEDTPVMFADGTTPSIREVVAGEMSGPVLSWDGQRIVERPIVGWHNNGILDESSGEEWLTFRIAGTGGTRGAQGFTCTPGHLLVTADGAEVPASDVQPGDHLLSWYSATLTHPERQILYGSLLGDGCLHTVEGVQSACFGLANSLQEGYLLWKMSIFTSRNFRRIDSCGRTCFKTESDFELGLVRREFYPEDDSVIDPCYRTIPLGVLKEASLQTLSVWYMDDGHYEEEHRHASLSVKRLSSRRAQDVAEVLSNRGYECSWSESQRSIVFTTASFELFSSQISPYVHPSMSAKLLPEHRQSCGTELVVGEPSQPRRVAVRVEVVDVWKSKRKMRAKTKYDLTVADDSFYLVGGDSRGVVVHNSPETKPGGMGQDFATSIDIRMWPGKYEKDESGNTLNIVTNFRCVKNKTAPAQMDGNFRLWLRDYGVRKAGDTEDVGVVLGQALKHGWLGNAKDGWGYADNKFKTKKETIQFLLSNPDAYEELRTGLFSDMLGTIASDKECLDIKEDDEVAISTVEEEPVEDLLQEIGEDPE